MIELFLIFIFYNYYRLEEEHLSEQLFLEMKNYSFFFEDERFDMEIVPKVEDSQLYELYFDESSLYVLTPFLEDENNSLAILYPVDDYHLLLQNIKNRLFFQFLLLSVMAGVVSFLFSLYTLSPLRASLRLLEEFIKDIIHDLNTPITSILINLKMMERNEEVESIEQSTNAIAMLHKNLDTYLKESKFDKERFVLKGLLQEQINFFRPLYSHLKWEVEIEESIIIHSNKNALSRIIYNLISNACKYNTTDGFIKIEARQNSLTISNSSYGIKNPSKIFERFYKESERGLGIGLHIVEKLCHELEIEKRLTVKDDTIFIRLTLN